MSLSNNATLIGYKASDLINKNYKNLLKKDNKKIIKSLIKPIYSS